MKLLMVYNAEAGFMNGVMDSMHKLFSPATYQCRLCELTHGTFGMHQEWKAFIEQLNIPFEFFHRPCDWFQSRRVSRIFTGENEAP